MADEEEERALENQLELQLLEQQDSLSALNDALASDPSNPELLSVQEELLQVIKDAKEGLLHLKRARLLREADSVLYASNHTVEDVKAEPLDPVRVEPEPLEDQCYSIGSKCRFRHVDGRWYNGQIVGLVCSDTAKIAFLTPTSENMLICKFFLQERCRFGTSCRLSHGVDVSLSALKNYVPTMWDQSLVGSSIWALSDSNVGIWRKADLESWDNEHRVGQVVFHDGGSSAKLGSEAMTISEYALMSDEEETDSSSEGSDSSDYEEESAEGLGFLESTNLQRGIQTGGLGFLESTNLQRGIQTGTAIFATWENHTRGIASKMMANMGYREGMGLGASGQGMLDPISVKVLPPKQSLDRALESQKRGSKIIMGRREAGAGKENAIRSLPQPLGQQKLQRK
ncbi:hypothetical protein OIU77_005387 [Salix suchowensis]|uniref:Uncharacterized protein n=1 Tax=Salix suchowensis TaxID=1278906 RepID=A0ABQ9AQV4_9ROSI|nr:hypothetical protein OIU77_005387 [Salix suchowensis]